MTRWLALRVLIPVQRPFESPPSWLFSTGPDGLGSPPSQQRAALLAEQTLCPSAVKGARQSPHGKGGNCSTSTVERHAPLSSFLPKPTGRRQDCGPWRFAAEKPKGLSTSYHVPPGGSKVHRVLRPLQRHEYENNITRLCVQRVFEDDEWASSLRKPMGQMQPSSSEVGLRRSRGGPKISSMPKQPNQTKLF